MRCICKESCFEGLACRHELCVYIKGSKSAESLYVHERWRADYFDVSKLPEIINDEDEVNEDPDETHPENEQEAQTLEDKTETVNSF